MKLKKADSDMMLFLRQIKSIFLASLLLLLTILRRGHAEVTSQQNEMASHHDDVMSREERLSELVDDFKHDFDKRRGRRGKRSVDVGRRDYDYGDDDDGGGCMILVRSSRTFTLVSKGAKIRFCIMKAAFC